ncbi:proFAR isomerase (HisA)-like protein [Methanocella conradii HZ254]|uniref:ProFAR isomerase (HisA)-like protein n=1 Tax=Methanocella conradii (strain DSM 24694 / JCM 17849 / CGMCC 1.5162 / HZ254) TaxID=1041930 RepID=H8I8D9_METCZ|nr:HisA/HisF-related TIM barrel protein [Methanocella conradii]AFC98992.1 proFAR isomerase (HisA)-like protein [Methanocella conradii HZ254]MDI6896763.1 HisA/HisF-related TIM barrel protein [Methanocella conradii]
MRCILACDLKGGIVVRGVRGERDKYRPIAESSRIVHTSDPVEVIRRLRPSEAYIADLDRITGAGDNLEVIKRLSGMTRTMVDAGISSPLDFKEAMEAAGSVIIGTETATLSAIEQCQGSRTIISLDMRHGRTMCRDPSLNLSPLEVIGLLNGMELAAVILLDVARVGTGEGVDASLVASAASASRHRIIVGGGVKDASDLELLERCGASGAIVASAIHDGRIPLSVLRA